MRSRVSRFTSLFPIAQRTIHEQVMTSMDRVYNIITRCTCMRECEFA